jgi:glycosyltransferase involved in cell wall biosynthesis
MKPARLLIVTNGPLARNPRVEKEARLLGLAGHDVTVLGIRNHAPSMAPDAALAAGAPFRHLQVDLLGPGPTVWLRRLRIRLTRDLGRRLGLSSIRSLGPADALLRAVRAHPAELVIVHNEIPHWIGARLIREGRRVGADIEDWHSEDLMAHDRIGRPIALLRAVEKGLLRGAVHLTTTSEALADGLHAAYGGRRPAVVTNSFPLPPAPRSTQAPSDGPPAFFWFSQTTGPGRGLELFLAAWARTTRPSRLVLLGEVADGYARSLLAALPAAFRPRVAFLPLVSPAELPALIARHDIGLALEQAFIRNRDLTITNKILQYLGAGLAVVASDTAGQREVLARDPAAGLVLPLHETTALGQALDELLADPVALRARQVAARRLAECHYCWEREGSRLLGLVEAALR